MIVMFGFDPGKEGGIVAVDSDHGGYISHQRIPLIGTSTRQRVDGRAVAKYLRLWLGFFDEDDEGPVSALLAYERVHSWATDSVVSAFTFGKVTGQVIGIAETLGIGMIDVPPKEWQRVMFRGHKYATKLQRKASAALLASDRHPRLSEVLSKKSNWGLADAALIVEHTRRQLIRGAVAPSQRS